MTKQLVAHVMGFPAASFKSEFLVHGVRIQAMTMQEAHTGGLGWEDWPVVWRTSQTITLDMLHFIFGGLFANGMYMLRWEIGDSIQGHYMDRSEFRRLSEPGPKVIT